MSARLRFLPMRAVSGFSRFAARISAGRLGRWALWSLLGLVLALAVLLAAALTAAPPVRDLNARAAGFIQLHHRRTLPLSAEAPLLREAVVATEDERFY